MRGTSILSALLLLVSGLFGSDVGSVCVAPVEKPTAGSKGLGNPSGGNQVQAYAVQIDSRSPVGTTAEHGVPINGLSLAGRHLIRISGDGKSVASFRFRFGDYGSNDLCLWFKPLY
jgi:hypothetical protein